MQADETVSFDLRNEPWIPVTVADGGEERLMSLVDVLSNACSIRSIGGDMPLQTPAIIRLLLAVLYGVYPDGPTEDEWVQLWTQGPDMDAITDYLDEFGDRWDLFDAEKPFYQVADLRTGKGDYSGLEKFILDVPNGAPFFTTRIGDGLSRITFAEAARWLVTVQAFDPSGIKSGAVGDPRVKGGKGYPIGVAWSGNLGVLVCEGENLWQTLLLNFVGKSLTINGRELPWEDDRPIWEREQPSVLATPGFDQEKPGDVRCFHGPATLMTWQSRRIRLVRDGEWVVGVIVANGDRLKPQKADRYETMTAWRSSKPQAKALGEDHVYMPRTHDPKRAIWRGIATYLPSGHTAGEVDDYTTALSVQWIRDLNTKHVLSNIEVCLHAYGVEYGSQSSVIDDVIDDAMDMHLHVLAASSPDDSDRLSIPECLSLAAELANSGVRICRTMAINLARASGVPSDSWKQQAEEQAYAAFDRLYRNWVAEIEVESQAEEAYRRWRDIVRATLADLGNDLLALAPPSAYVGRYDSNQVLWSASKADVFFRGAIRKLLGDAQ